MLIVLICWLVGYLDNSFSDYLRTGNIISIHKTSCVYLTNVSNGHVLTRTRFQMLVGISATKLCGVRGEEKTKQEWEIVP